MKNGDILKMYEALVQIAEDKTQKFSVRVSYLFAKNKAALREEASLIYSTRQKILMEYGNMDGNGDIVIPREKIEEVNGKINELMEIENNAQFEKMPLEWLDDYELSVEYTEALMPMLIEPLYTGPVLLDN